MSSPRSTRRYAVLLYASVCMLVLGGLGWATYSAVELERDRLERLGRDATAKSFHERLTTALWQIEGYVQPVWARELGRPFTDFLPFYTPTELRDAPSGLPVTTTLQVPSPLLMETRTEPVGRPAWLLLHFQGSEQSGWSSPQLPGGTNTHAAAWEVPAGRRQRAHWLNALARMYDPPDLQRLLEESRQLAERLRGRALEGAEIASQATSKHASNSARPHAAEMDRGDADYLRRGERAHLLGVQSMPPEQCGLERVFADNLPTGAENATEKDNCVCVSLEPMTPVWLELAGPREQQLAFVRRVTVEGASTYFLQGVLIDWMRLRAVLEEEAGKLLPGARIVPVRPGDPIQADALPLLMTTLSARLDPPLPENPAPVALSTGLMTGLASAWIVAVLALAAIGYGAMKYVALAERRMRFVSAVTHELRTPLTTFQLYTDLLADSPQNGDHRQTEYIETLRGESKRLSRLVENVLAYSRMGRQTPVLHERPIQITRLLDSVRTSSAELCQSSGRTLIIENRCQPQTAIETDAEFVVQILSNLIENACKYGVNADDGRIWLTARLEPGRGVLLELEDPGPGIAPQDRREVFRAFRRGRNGQESTAQGVGLGLTLSRHWAQCLGGDLSVRHGNRNPDHYACFVLNLPDRIRTPGAAAAS